MTDILDTISEAVLARNAEMAAKDDEIEQKEIELQSAEVMVRGYQNKLAEKDSTIAALTQLNTDLAASVTDREDQIERLRAELALLKPKFRMFDATARLVMGAGFEPMPVIGESRFYPTTDRTLDLGYIRNTTMPRWRRDNPTATMFCIDDEHHGRSGYLDAEIDEMMAIATVVREFDPTLKLLWYGVPMRSQNHLAGDIEGETAAWLAESKRMQRLLALMDFGAISIYPLTTNPGLFDRYCRSNIAMWREVMGDMPVYPFVCPTYHRNAGPGLEGTPIPAEMMRSALDACHELADGLCIWNWAAQNRDRTLPWSVELDSFVERMN